MRIGWPSFSLTCFPTMRATTSTPPPGANGTSRRIGRVGYGDWARADQVAMHAANAATSIRPVRRLRLLARILAAEDRVPGAVGNVAVRHFVGLADGADPAGLPPVRFELVHREAAAEVFAGTDRRLHDLSVARLEPDGDRIGARVERAVLVARLF